MAKSAALRAVEDERAPEDEAPKVVEVTLDPSTVKWSDLIEIGKVAGLRVTMSMLNDPPLEVIVGIAWLQLRQTNRALTYREVAEMPIGEMQIVPK